MDTANCVIVIPIYIHTATQTQTDRKTQNTDNQTYIVTTTVLGMEVFVIYN